MALRHKQYWRKRYLLPEGIDSKHPFYVTWANMVKRCTKKYSTSYKNYGAKGIDVCDDWKSFDNFYSDMYPGYKMGLTLERIDNKAGYNKINCKWIPKSQQSRNRSVVTLYDGKTLGEWAKELGVNRSTLAQRLYIYGWNIEECLTGRRV